MLPEVLVRIFWYLKNTDNVELVCSFWRECAHKTCHLKTSYGLDKISTQIKPKSQLIPIVRKLNTKFLRTNFSKLIKLRQMTKSVTTNWLQLDRACKFLKKSIIKTHLFEFFKVIRNRELYHEYDNKLKSYVIESLKKRNLPWNSLFHKDLCKTGKFYFAINIEHQQKLKKIALTNVLKMTDSLTTIKQHVLIL